MAGIDREEALDRLAGSENLLVRLVRSFYRKYADVREGLLACLEEGRAVDLRDKAHELKGAAGNVSANEIARLAGELEGTSEPSRAKSLIEDITGSFLRLGVSLGEEESPAPELEDPAELEELFRLLETQDLEALETLEKVSPLLRERMPAEAFERFQQHCEELQFEKALALLRDSL